MTRGDDGWWTPGGRPVARRRGGRLRLPDRRRRTRRDPTRGRGVSRRASTSARAPSTPRRYAWTDERLDRPPARRRGDLRAARRHVHPGGHARRGARPARPPALDRRRLRRADAGQRLQRHPQLGLRRRALVRRPRAVRRPGGLPAVRRRLPRGRPRRDPGRGLQPPRAVGELPARVRAVPQGGRATPGATWSTSTARARRRCAATSSTTSRMWLDGLPRRRAAARRRARPRRRLRAAPARGDGDRGGRAVGAPAPAADPDRRVRPQRPGLVTPARGRRLRARRAVERRLPPRRARRADRRDARLLRRLRAAGRAGQGLRARVLPRRHLLVVPRPRPRRADRHRGHADLAARGLQPEPRPGRQPRRRRPASPRPSTTTSSRAPRC